MMQRSVYGFESLYLHWKKENVVKAFLSNILMLDYDHRQGFLKLLKKSVSIWLDNQISGA